MMNSTLHRLLVIALVLTLGSGAALAIQTAFWRPYVPDPAALALLHLDGNGDNAAGEAGGRLTGDASFVSGGRFGGALRLGGQGALVLAVPKVLPGTRVSLEAWVRLDRYSNGEAAIISRPAIVDAQGTYNAATDRASGFELLVDSRGALHLQATNVMYSHTSRTSSPPGAVPVGQWVHVAGIMGGAGNTRRVYVNGEEVAGATLEYVEALRGEEREAPPIFVGNNQAGTAGLSGLVDEVRVHTVLMKLWPPEDMSWTAASAGQPLPSGPPQFLPEHQPTLILPFDGNTRATVGSADAPGPAQYIQGVRGQGRMGPFTISGTRLLDQREGSMEFWMQPIGVENFTDFNKAFVSFNPGHLYIFNAGAISPAGLPLTLYFQSGGKPVFVKDTTGMELYEGRWIHVVLTWQGNEILMYLDGHQAGSAAGASMFSGGDPIVRSIRVLENVALDELRLYDRALLPSEAANAFLRYRNPRQLRSSAPVALRLSAGYLPTSNTIFYTVTPQAQAGQVRQVRLRLVDQGGRELLRRDVPFSTAEQQLAIPDLGDGDYELQTSAITASGQALEGESFSFTRQRFPWEGNRLGFEETVYPPFMPVTVSGQEARVVQRRLQMNGFGLWDQVVSQDRELLAGPMRLRLETAQGEAQWSQVRGGFGATSPVRATYSGEAVSTPLRLRSTCEIETDGCMKVTMDLQPGSQRQEIRRLWIEIPLKAAETPLMHVVTDGVRRNPAGQTPAGEGVIWDSTRAPRYNTLWQNSFVPYIWLGGGERGLAWFGENDRGWLTERGGSTRPLQELVREGDRLVLRVYLCNTPTTLTAPTQLVFGLQVSPTKPMPPDWRARIGSIPSGLPDSPWGGLHSAYQTPYRDDWTIVDKIIEARRTGRADEAWFQQYAQRHNPPPVHGTWPWLTSVVWFANQAATVGMGRPLATYQEEMMASLVRDEYCVYQDEWRTVNQAATRDCPDESVLRQGKSARPNAPVTFSESYRDFGVYVADQWLQRGVSLYWDNTYPHLSQNTRTTAAYRTASGAIQPCVIIWNQRAYMQRVWQRLNYWRAQRPEPLEWIVHMTNTLLLPVHTWATAQLDNELQRNTPFPPDYLRAESIGRQVGNFPLSLYSLAGSENEIVKRLPPEQRERIDWGMRAVHEIQRRGGPEQLLTTFGYGTELVQVGNYWADQPMAQVSDPQVKWLALSRPPVREMLLVLASWSEQAVAPRLTLDAAVMGFDPAGLRVRDAETGEVLSADAGGGCTVPLPGPYGVRVLRVGGN